MRRWKKEDILLDGAAGAELRPELMPIYFREQAADERKEAAETADPWWRDELLKMAERSDKQAEEAALKLMDKTAGEA